MKTNFKMFIALIGAVLLTASVPLGVHFLKPNQPGPQGADHVDSEKNPFPLRYVIPAEARRPKNIIASFDDMAELQNDTERYEVTGMLASPSLGEYSHPLLGKNTNFSSLFFGTDDSAFWDGVDWKGFGTKTGMPDGIDLDSLDAAFTTCSPLGRGPGNIQTCEYLMGAIRVKGVEVRSDYINFWARSWASEGSVGIRLLNHGTTAVLASWSDDSCNDLVLPESGNEHWNHFDARALKGQVVDILVFDMNKSQPCGRIAFDHFYQSDIPRGRLADVASALAPQGVDSDGDGIEDARDAYPHDAMEWSDRDHDGTGDNADRFPDDPAEVADSDNDGVGDNADANPDDPSVTFTVTNLSLHLEGTVPRNIIETFDDPLAIQANKSRYELTGMFSSEAVARGGWESASWPARIGKASVSTIFLRGSGAGGTIRIKNVALHSDYINFLMAGGQDTGADFGGVGVKLYAAGTDETLASYKSEAGVLAISSRDPWYHFDVSALKGQSVDIYIHDESTQYLAFDHFYQGNVPRGALADTARKPRH